MLNRIDEALEVAMHDNPSLLLVQPNDSQKSTTGPLSGNVISSTEEAELAENIGGSEKDEGPAIGEEDRRERATELVLSCLRFLAILMRNCVNKHVFCSTEVKVSCVQILTLPKYCRFWVVHVLMFDCANEPDSPACLPTPYFCCDRCPYVPR